MLRALVKLTESYGDIHDDGGAQEDFDYARSQLRSCLCKKGDIYFLLPEGRISKKHCDEYQKAAALNDENGINALKRHCRSRLR